MGDLRDQLMVIRSEHGRLTPEVVVEAATPEDHPLHHRFEWDNAIAGPNYRRIQAADLIRSVRVTYKPATDGAFKSIRAFHVITTPEGVNAYEPIETVVEDPMLRQMVLRDMERDWRALRQRYEDFNEFWVLIQGDLANTA